jgi:hypothetical protein
VTRSQDEAWWLPDGEPADPADASAGPGGPPDDAVQDTTPRPVSGGRAADPAAGGETAAPPPQPSDAAPTTVLPDSGAAAFPDAAPTTVLPDAAPTTVLAAGIPGPPPSDAVPTTVLPDIGTAAATTVLPTPAATRVPGPPPVEATTFLPRPGVPQPPRGPATYPGAATAVAATATVGAAAAEAPPIRRAGPVRRTLGALAALLCALAVVTSGVAWWAQRVMLDTDRFTAAAMKAVNDPAVQQFVATEITNQASPALTSAAATAQRFLPSFADSLIGEAQNWITGEIQQAALTAAQSDGFAKVAETSITAAHRDLTAALAGEQGAILRTEDEGLALSLDGMRDVFASALSQRGLGLLVYAIPDDLGSVPLLTADQVADARSAYAVQQAARWAAPLLAVVGLVGAIAAGRSRRGRLAGAALACGFSSAALVVAVIARGFTINRLSGGSFTGDGAVRATTLVLTEDLTRWLATGAVIAGLLALLLGLLARRSRQ